MRIGDGGVRPFTKDDVTPYLERQRQRSAPNYPSDLKPARDQVKAANSGARFMCIRIGCTQANGIQSWFLTEKNGKAHEYDHPGDKVIPI